jgi:hypothetical protein
MVTPEYTSLLSGRKGPDLGFSDAEFHASLYRIQGASHCL